MEKHRYFWVFDRTAFDQIALPEFTLLEGVLIVTSLILLGLYLLLIVFLDRRQRLRRLRGKQMAWLERWLAEAALTPGEGEQLDRLAGEATDSARYALLSDPVRFETRVHETLAAGPRAGGGNLAEKLREKLAFHSHNLRVPVVSTRQFLPGDSLRLTLWQGGLPNHFYGRVVETGQEKFAVEIRPEAVKLVAAEGTAAEMAYLRGLGLEYPFGDLAAQPGSRPERLVLRHGLTRIPRGARRARLPLLMEVSFRRANPSVQSEGEDKVADLDPEAAPARKERGLLLDVSSGGFAMGHRGEAAEGDYFEFSLPLRRGRRPLQLTGRVQQCRPFSGDQWLSRCALRGLTALERNRLTQILRLEQRNRLKTLAPIRRQRAKTG